jgi:hypothetical protein
MLGPNITGAIGARAHSSGFPSVYSGVGAFYKTEQSTLNDHGLASSGFNQLEHNTFFSASMSNSIYGSSTTVQPKSMNLNILIKY